MMLDSRSTKGMSGRASAIAHTRSPPSISIGLTRTTASQVVSVRDFWSSTMDGTTVHVYPSARAPSARLSAFARRRSGGAPVTVRWPLPEASRRYKTLGIDAAWSWARIRRHETRSMLAATTTSGSNRRRSTRKPFSGTAHIHVGWSGVSTRRIRRPRGRCTASSAGRNRLARSLWRGRPASRRTGGRTGSRAWPRESPPRDPVR